MPFSNTVFRVFFPKQGHTPYIGNVTKLKSRWMVSQSVEEDIPLECQPDILKACQWLLTDTAKSVQLDNGAFVTKD